MILEIPGEKNIEVKNVAFDYNGTIAEDGILIENIEEKIVELSNKKINIYVLTADTFGTVKKQCSKLPVQIKIFDKENASIDKKRIIQRIGSDVTVSIGNGRNDLEMFKSSALSIAVIGKEGCYLKTLFEADIVVNDIVDAIDLMLKPNRIKSTLRT